MMDTRFTVEEAFLAALHVEPTDAATWLALADWLEENHQSRRAELGRLMRRLRDLPTDQCNSERARVELHIADLLTSGVRPVVAEVVNSIGMRLALVAPGAFCMGCSPDEAGGHEEEGPLHEVELTQAFYLGVFPVTQGQYSQIMGKNPSWFCRGGGGEQAVRNQSTECFPVEGVSWDDAVEFCRRLSEEREPGRQYRLPSEAEWEFACRAGTTTPFHFGATLSSAQANFDASGPYGRDRERPVLMRTTPVGSYPPNAWGLYDMHGNVDEWCAEWLDPDYYRASPRQNPTGPREGDFRVVRGGGWNSIARECRAARREGCVPASRFSTLGFRVALSLTGAGQRGQSPRAKRAGATFSGGKPPGAPGQQPAGPQP
jgi:uncharacterized protein (TIGR02996 family)